METSIKKAKIEELKYDDKNFNIGSETGNRLLENSITRMGFREAATLDKNGILVGGNKRVAKAGEIGFQDVEIIKADPKKVYALQFDDIDITTPQGRELALALNATAKENIVFDAELIHAELGEAIAEDWNIHASNSNEGDKGIYTRNIKAPTYETSNTQPDITELFDLGKTASLAEQIEAADIPDEIKYFLKLAAQRHTVFHYDKIADYYAHATPEVQYLFEQSAIVIIDFNAAIEAGFIKLTQSIHEQYNNDYPDAED